jgi:hypothetical protein
VSRKGEEENQTTAIISGSVGKRKAETGGSNFDDQRHLKIRKWEDYLEEEIETDLEDLEKDMETGNEEAEAAMQPRPQP